MATRHDIQTATEAIRAGNFGQAAEILGGILRGQPGNEKARWLMIQSLERLGRFEDVQAQIETLLRHVARDLAKITHVAMFARQRGYPLDTVVDAFGKFLAKTPTSAVAAYNHAYYLEKNGQHAQAIAQYQRALDLGIKSPEEVHLNMANAYMDHLQDPEKARAHLEKALELNPGYLQAHFNLGNLAERTGDREAALARFGRCLEIEPDNEFALARMADASRFEKPDDPLLARMAERAASSENVDLHFALGRAYDQLGVYDDAWRHFERANELDRAAHPEYRQSRSEALTRRIMARCDARWLEQFDGESHDPVFMCGIFRSGSTLLEQILAAHPRFTAGGESEFIPRLVARHLRGYPDGLEHLSAAFLAEQRARHAEMCEQRTSGQTRLTDKRPDNFLYVGLIRAMIPNARFIVTERDWRDVAVSVFSTRLGPGQRYATRLQDIRHYLGLHRELIDHWASLLGDGLFRVSYETLVEEPREAIGAVLEFLGEDWDDACLEFHNRKSLVGTASVWQVRQPLNTSSIGRWENYRKYFEEAFGDV